MKSHVKVVDEAQPHFPVTRREVSRVWWDIALIALVLFSTVQGYLEYKVLEAKADKYIQAISKVDHRIVRLEQVVASHAEEDAIFLKIFILKSSIDKDLARKIAKVVHEQAKLFKRDPDLILSIMRIESNFNPEAISKVGAVGLMQVMPQWIEQLGIVGNLADIETNVKYGLQILAFYDQMYKDLNTTLSAYNRGPGKIDYDLMKGRDPNRNGYARKVLEVHGKLRQLTTTPDP